MTAPLPYVAWLVHAARIYHRSAWQENNTHTSATGYRNMARGYLAEARFIRAVQQRPALDEAEQRAIGRAFGKARGCIRLAREASRDMWQERPQCPLYRQLKDEAMQDARYW